MIRVYSALEHYCIEVSAHHVPQSRGESSGHTQLLHRGYFSSDGTPGPAALGRQVHIALSHINGYAGTLAEHWDKTL